MESYSYFKNVLEFSSHLTLLIWFSLKLFMASSLHFITHLCQQTRRRSGPSRFGQWTWNEPCLPPGNSLVTQEAKRKCSQSCQSPLVLVPCTKRCDSEITWLDDYRVSYGNFRWHPSGSTPIFLGGLCATLQAARSQGYHGKWAASNPSCSTDHHVFLSAVTFFIFLPLCL